MSKVLVLGKSGQLASELRVLKKDAPGYTFVGKEEIDAFSPNACLQVIEKVRPEFVINCMAYTAVDRAESEREACNKLNRDFVADLAKTSVQAGFHLVHFSTDYVFNGNASKPYLESDPVDPVNFYGLSKLEGERAIFENSKSATIVRTSWVYSRFGHNFVKTMLRLANEKKTMRVVADQQGCPTWAADLARVTVSSLLEKTNNVDLFHFSGEGISNWHAFAQKILALQAIDHPVEPIATTDFPTPAKRPHYSVLSKEKIKNEFRVNVPHWEESLERCLAEWEKN